MVPTSLQLLSKRTLLPVVRNVFSKRSFAISTVSRHDYFCLPNTRIFSLGLTGNNHRIRTNPIQRGMVVVSQHKSGSQNTVATEGVQVSSSLAKDLEPAVPSHPVNYQNFESKENQRAEQNGDSSSLLSVSQDNSLIITNSCWNHMARLAAKKGYGTDQVYLRVFVDAGGCSGFTYKFEFHTAADDEIDLQQDLVWVGPNQSRVVVDVGSMGFLKGATLDYVVEMIKSSFEIRDNPQSESACGCGSSFAVKKFSSNPAID